MADRTVRAIFEARVSGAQKGMRDFAKDVDGAGKKVDGLTKDLAALSKSKVNPQIDVKIADAKKRLTDLTAQLANLKTLDASPEVTADIKKAQDSIREVRAEIKDLNGQKAEVQVDASITNARKKLEQVTIELGQLRTLEATPEVDADIKDAQRRMREVKSELRDLNAAKAEMKVTADTSPAKSAIDDLAGDVGEAGDKGGEDAGQGIVSGILDALRTIPIAGAVIGVGVAIAGGLLLGIKQGLSVEAERDLFSAQTGLDEDTSARFGRAAGEAYANAWGDSVASNLDAAKFALKAGIIDSDATDAEIQNVIAKLQGLNDLFQYDIAESVRGVGNLMKSGLVKDANQAFDLIVAASQKVQSDDLIDTLNEYSTQFKTLGLTGEQAFGLIAQGAAAGARDTDNIADTLKEMGLRIREGTTPAITALDNLGLRADDIVKAFQKGGPNAVAAMDKVFDALRDLEERGGNTQAVIAALFGGPGEDLGAALYALDLDTVAEALGGVDGAAGAADRALTTMSDNTAAKMESAKRNVEIAMDGIKGALAEAFGDEIAGAADWVSKNRAPLMEFFLDVINGTLDMSRAFLEFAANSQEAIAGVIEGIAELVDALPGDQSEWKRSVMGVADGLREGADAIRSDFIPALDEAKDKANQWAAPEILKARIHDATMAMAADMDTFTKGIDQGDYVIRINGSTVNAEQALQELVDNINAEDGTVTIDGETVDAEDALDRLLELISEGAEDVTVGADTRQGQADVRTFKGIVSRAEATMSVYADTEAANKKLRELERTRYATLKVSVQAGAGVGAVLGLTGGHAGGWLGKGLHAGGYVPGRDPGYDNVLWPLNSGGRTLSQPLAGGEYVVNSGASSLWGPLLEAINGGLRPSQITETNNAPVYIDKVVGLTIAEVEREAASRRRRDALSPSKGG